MTSLLDRDPSPQDLEAERDQLRPGVWVGEPGADLRALTQDETDALVRYELWWTATWGIGREPSQTSRHGRMSTSTASLSPTRDRVSA